MGNCGLRVHLLHQHLPDMLCNVLRSQIPAGGRWDRHTDLRGHGLQFDLIHIPAFCQIPVDLKVLVRQPDIVHLLDLSDRPHIINGAGSESVQEPSKPSGQILQVQIQVIQPGSQVFSLLPPAL